MRVPAIIRPIIMGIFVASTVIVLAKILFIVLLFSYQRDQIRSLLSPQYDVLESGTGFVISKRGLILTGGHVVRNCAQVTVSSSGQYATARKVVAEFDAIDDIAVLLIDKKDYASLNLQNSIFTLASNDTTAFSTSNKVLGYTREELQTAPAVIPVSKMTKLKIIEDDKPARFLLALSARIRPGMSGSPMLDSDGFVTGMVTRAEQSLIHVGGNEMFLDEGEAMPVSRIRDWLSRHGIDQETGHVIKATPAPVRILCKKQGS